jgi:glycosyltransferase involved in cell wall biosynthesis
MIPLSVVIITRNEEHHIADCIRSALLVSEDVIVVDAGSTDHTVSLARSLGARVFVEDWKGYGNARNSGAARARFNWILSLDADERVSKLLAYTIHQLTPEDDAQQFSFRRRNFLGSQLIRFGNPGFEKVTRIYNRNHAAWDQALVHERLTAPHFRRKRINGYINHIGVNPADYFKIEKYAELSAEKYFQEGRKGGFLKRFLSAFFNATKSYIFQLGFLDGTIGLLVARKIARYSWLKYYYLHQLQLRHRENLKKFNRKMKTAAN